MIQTVAVVPTAGGEEVVLDDDAVYIDVKPMYRPQVPVHVGNDFRWQVGRARNPRVSGGTLTVDIESDTPIRAVGAWASLVMKRRRIVGDQEIVERAELIRVVL